MRTKRGHIPGREKGDVIADLAKGRSAAVRVLTLSRISGPEYKAASDVLDAIDALVRELGEP